VGTGNFTNIAALQAVYVMREFRVIVRFLSLLGWMIPAFGPAPVFSQCKPSGVAFCDGEDISYEVVFNWGPIWIKAGKVDFQTELAGFKGKPCWCLTSTGKTVPSIEFLFKVRDTYKTWIDTSTYHTIEFQRYIYESGYQLQNTSWFDYRNRLIISNTKRNEAPLVTDTLRMRGCSFDMLASCFYVRSMNFDTLAPNQSFPINIAIDDSIYTISVNLLGREIIETADGNHYACLKFVATMVAGTVFEEDQEAFIWVSDDRNHIPVYIESKIIVGSVKAFLTTAKGLKYPLALILQKK